MGFAQIGYQTFKLLAYQRLHEMARHWEERYPGVDIVLIEPEPDDELMFQTSIMDYTTRHRHRPPRLPVGDAASSPRTTSASSEVCARHGIEISATRVRKVVKHFDAEREKTRAWRRILEQTTATLLRQSASENVEKKKKKKKKSGRQVRPRRFEVAAEGERAQQALASPRRRGSPRASRRGVAERTARPGRSRSSVPGGLVEFRTVDALERKRQRKFACLVAVASILPPPRARPAGACAARRRALNAPGDRARAVRRSASSTPAWASSPIPSGGPISVKQGAGLCAPPTA